MMRQVTLTRNVRDPLHPGHSRNPILFEKFGGPSGRVECVPPEPRLDMNEGPKLGSGDYPVNVHNWVQPTE
jgi:hypothetical protein